VVPHGGCSEARSEQLQLELVQSQQVRSEERRVRALHALDALDVDVDPRFQLMVAVARQWFDVPMVSITLVDAHRQWRVAFCGPLDREGPVNGAVCPAVMFEQDIVVLPDLTRDPRFAESPYVTGGPRLRFYAGHPLRTADGEPIGAFCLMDSRPRGFSQADHEVLSGLGHWVQSELLSGVRAGTSAYEQLPA
jgi:GAF domain-containing protein